MGADDQTVEVRTMGAGSGHHAWLRLVPDKITSWDFRKKVSFEDYDFG